MAIKIKRGDRRPGAAITANADLSTATNIQLLGKLGSTLIIDRPVTGNANGQVLIETWETADTQNVGLLQLEIEVTWPDGTTQTSPGDRYLEVDIIPDLG